VRGQVWEFQVSVEGMEEENAALRARLAELQARYMRACASALEGAAPPAGAGAGAGAGAPWDETGLPTDASAAAPPPTPSAYACSSTPQSIAPGGTGGTAGAGAARARSRVDWERVVSSGRESVARLTAENAQLERVRPRPAPRTNRTRRVLHPVLIGHVSSFPPY
jgi:hypothetical protein